MKKTVKKHSGVLLALLLLTLTIIPVGMMVASAMGGEDNPGFNLFEVAGEIPESFISEVTDLIQSNWEENYFSAITMKLGEAEMFVDGSKGAVTNPAYIDKGEIMLPIIDIAYAVGADVDIDETTGNITIINDGETTIIDLEQFTDNDYSLPEIEVEYNSNQSDSSLLLPVQEGRIMIKSPELKHKPKKSDYAGYL